MSDFDESKYRRLNPDETVRRGDWLGGDDGVTLVECGAASDLLEGSKVGHLPVLIWCVLREKDTNTPPTHGSAS